MENKYKVDCEQYTYKCIQDCIISTDVDETPLNTNKKAYINALMKPICSYPYKFNQDYLTERSYLAVIYQFKWQNINILE